jgi:TetR/AcrR family transcriptional regulator, mexJK operon transcriptional repressor
LETPARAAISSTLVPTYRHFADKEQLFSEIVLRTIDQVGEPLFAWIGALDGTKDLEAALRELARKLVAIVRAPRWLELRRPVIGESARFPELGRTYFERGPGARSTRSPPSSSAWPTAGSCVYPIRG